MRVSSTEGWRAWVNKTQFTTVLGIIIFIIGAGISFAAPNFQDASTTFEATVAGFFAMGLGLGVLAGASIVSYKKSSEQISEKPTAK